MNATPSYVVHVHGQDPQFLVDKIVRRKIYDCNFWKVYCTSLEQDTVIHRVLELFYVGGTFGAYEEPSPFLCLLLKLLQVQPPLELVTGIFTRSTNPHVRVLAAMYTRMVAPSAVIYETLEPLLFDRAPVRTRAGIEWGESTVDTIVGDLIDDQFVFNITLPHLVGRRLLVARNELGPMEWPEGVEAEARAVVEGE